ncbi:hypothetical protein PFISCL1PPCAC_18394 [Pristionchus fissidentatus]|uniref:Uncharacterized protein n=1 Tax=Pristionchus fissidentatus TaxID=1538716 RepID=A0AAV5W5I9_9BILA|nr:hypothetical protein PFISCL1PPCAC_18394 [Pristionchus fissidentatus]
MFLLQICVDSLFFTGFSRLIEALKTVTSLTFSGVTVSNEFDLAEISEFLLRVKVRRVNLQLETKRSVAKHFNEGFLEQFAAEPSQSCALAIKICKMADSIAPSKEFLERVLCRFSSFIFLSMNVNADYLIDLIALRLRIKKKGIWKFTVDSLLDYQELQGRADNVDLWFNYNERRGFFGEIGEENDWRARLGQLEVFLPSDEPIIQVTVRFLTLDDLDQPDYPGLSDGWLEQ